MSIRCSKDEEKSASSGDLDNLEINAVLTLGEPGVEDAYVSFQASVLRCPITKYDILEITFLYAGKLRLIPPYPAFSSLDRKLVRFTIPLSTVRRVEQLNAHAGVYALSLVTWHAMKIVSLCAPL